MTSKSAHEVPVSLYKSADKIYRRSIIGTFGRLRVVAAIALLGIFYLLPWLSWNDQPLVLFDLPARRFHIFGLVLVPQDLFLLTGLLIVAAMTLFFFTTLAGRLWCGYACPQTVWTEAFMWMEQWVEGDRLQRIKLDRAPWGLRKLRLRLTKHALWLSFSLWTGLSFVGFFVPIRELLGDALNWELHGWALFWSVFYGFATWGNAGFMREQVCRYMCPYARFQSVMFDRDTLIIAYDEKRGEPRKRKAETPDAQGDCIDCTMCVQVCPTGIDIRDGLQYECIACAACVDACDSVMDQIGKPRGLVRYSSTRRDETGRFSGLLRPRLIAYGVVWLAVLVGFSAVLFTRSPLELDAIRDRHAMVRTLSNGTVENIYTLKITNKTERAQQVEVTAIDDTGTPVELSQSSFAVAPLQTLRAVISVAAVPRDAVTFGLTFEAHWAHDPQPLADAEARFIGRSLQ